MTQVVISIPTNEVNFLSILADKLGWKMETKENLLQNFLDSAPNDANISDEEIQAEVNAVRYGK